MPVVVAYPAFKNKNSNPFQSLLYAEMQALGWEVYDLDSAWSQFRRADILHLHWPDGFVFHPSLVKSISRFILLIGILKLYRLMGARVIWTVHNLQSHEHYHPRFEKYFWRILYRHLDAWIALNRFTESQIKTTNQLKDLPGQLIRHGLYPKVGKDCKEQIHAKHDKSLLFIGNLRQYKEIPRLVETFEQLHDPGFRLVIAGQCHSPELNKFLKEKEEVERLTIINRFISNDELSELLHASNYVVIPYNTLNSGIVFLALSYGKPLIAPKTPVLEEIQQDFGMERIRLYSPPLTCKSLKDVLERYSIPSSNNQQESEKVNANYTWAVIAAQHNIFFESLL